MSEVVQWIFIIVTSIGQVMNALTIKMIIDMISKHTDKLKELNNCKSNILTNPFKLSEDILALKKQYEILKENVKAIEDDLAGFVGPINEFEDYAIKEINKFKTDLDFIESKVTGNTDAIDGLEVEIRDIRKEMDFHAAANIERHDDLNRHVTIIENKVNENTEAMYGLEAEINNIRDDMKLYAEVSIERYKKLRKNQDDLIDKIDPFIPVPINDLKNLKNGDCDGDDVGKIADPA